MPRSGRPASSARVARLDATLQSWASTPAVRERMQRQRTRDTTPELAVRRILHAAGFRYRVDFPPLRGLRRRADLVFGPARVALFIDGCFWHGCPEHSSSPTNANSEYWLEKIRRNRERDHDTDMMLECEGWVSLRAWEHEDPAEVAQAVMKVVSARRRPAQS